MLKTKDKRKGIRHIIDGKGLKITYMQKLLTESGIPGKWDCYQNVVNLISGYTSPLDPYVYIFLSEHFNIDLKEIMYCYSYVKKDSQRVEFEINEKDLF